MEGHTVSAFTVDGSQTEIGRSENCITYVTISDADGKDVTKNYTVLFENGKLKVTYR